MKRMYLSVLAAIGAALILSSPAFSQRTYVRSGQTAGGPGAYGRPGELNTNSL